MPFDFIIAVAKVVIIFSMVMGIVPVLIWMERKGAAYIQDRRGPNRAHILGIRLGGLVHSLADAIKLLTKEEVMPSAAVTPLYLLAPMLAMFVAIVAVAVVPFTAPVEIEGYIITLQVADLQAGLVYVFAISSLGVFALLLAGFASNSKFSLLAALRAAAQMISYELALGLAALALFLVSGTFSLQGIVLDQGAEPWCWNAVRQPIAFCIFFTAMLAEANRLPFDLPEGESELVAGYHTEYSSMRFALFFLGEYAHVVVGSAVAATLFFGGWQFPFVGVAVFRQHAEMILLVGVPLLSLVLIFFGGWLYRRRHLGYGDLRNYEARFFGLVCALAGAGLLIAFSLVGGMTMPAWMPSVMIFVLQLATMFAKTLALAAVFIWIRWTLPRFRYDQLMKLGWKVLVPLGMANAAVTASVVLMMGG